MLLFSCPREVKSLVHNDSDITVFSTLSDLEKNVSINLLVLIINVSVCNAQF